MKNNTEYFKNWYLKLSKNDRRLSAKRARQDVNFIKKVLNLPKNSKILDLCCGHGRHSILLAKKYNITSLDINDEALKILKHEAKIRKLSIRIVKGDMRRIPFRNEFDAAINIFTSFGYFSDDKQNLKVLSEIRKSLKKGGKLILDLRNRQAAIKSISSSKAWMRWGNNYILQENKFNKNKQQEEVRFLIINPKGKMTKTGFLVKSYTLSKIKKMLQKTGFKILKTYGSTANFSPFTVKSSRLIILAEKK